MTVSRATVTIRPSTSSAGQRVRLTRRASRPQVTSGERGADEQQDVVDAEAVELRAGEGAGEQLGDHERDGADGRADRHGRRGLRSMAADSRNSVQAALAATAPSTSSSHCMPVPSGALNGTVRASPSSAEGHGPADLRRGMLAARS